MTYFLRPPRASRWLIILAAALGGSGCGDSKSRDGKEMKAVKKNDQISGKEYPKKDKPAEPSDVPKKEKRNLEVRDGSKLSFDPAVEMVKKGIFKIDESRTIGDVLDRSRAFKSQVWKKQTTDDGRLVVRFEGQLSANASDKELKQWITEAKAQNAISYMTEIGPIYDWAGGKAIRISNLKYFAEFAILKSDSRRFTILNSGCEFNLSSKKESGVRKVTIDSVENLILKTLYQGGG